MTTTPQAALLSEADMLDCLREATHEIPTRIPPGWRKVMQAAEKRILAKLQDGRNTPFGREAEKLADNYLDLQAQYADAVAKLQATQEPVQSVPEAMRVVTEALRSDPDYAWSWHCNVAMASVDEGMGHYEANQAAARFMRLLAGVDTTKHQGFPEAPEQEPVQAGELLLQGGLTNEQLREAFGEKMPGVVPSDRDLTLFALGIEVGAAELADERRMKKMYFDERNSARDAWRRAADQREEARATLSARKPLPYDLICNAIDLADTESMKGDYMLDYSDCIAVVRTMQALIEINGIGLEVKP